MFGVYYKVTNKKVKVYSVQNDKNGYPKFLVNVDNEWKWVSAKHFVGECNHEWELFHKVHNDCCDGGYFIVYKCKNCGKLEAV